uniref:Uncharacterized protein n=1 Tax=Sipha flava TaxID=143950 RepID=A0A2S2QK93_9HEMI
MTVVSGRLLDSSKEESEHGEPENVIVRIPDDALVTSRGVVLAEKPGDSVHTSTFQGNLKDNNILSGKGTNVINAYAYLCAPYERLNSTNFPSEITIYRSRTINIILRRKKIVLLMYIFITVTCAT